MTNKVMLNNKGKLEFQTNDAPEAACLAESIDPLSANYLPKWHNMVLPDGFEIVDESQPGKAYGALYETGVRPKGEAVPKRISGACWVSSLTHSTDGKEWGLDICFIDLDGNEKNITCSRRLLHDRNSELIVSLVTSGFEVVPGQENKLLRFIGAWKPEARLTCVTKLGWIGQGFGYMLADGPVGVSDVVFQPERNLTFNRGSSGQLTNWQTSIAIPACRHTYGIFALCSSFAPPLLKCSGLNSFGLHLFGNTSRGKTTMAQISASAWGKASDPSVDPEGSFIKRWHMTANAQEALSAASNDGLYVLDELGAITIKDASALLYNIFGGRGKEAMNADRSLKSARTWRMILLSTGEIPVSKKFEESGQALRGGHVVRFLDLSFESNFTKEEVDGLKEACGREYGLAGPLFVKSIIEHHKDESNLNKELAKEMESWVSALIAHRTLQPEQERAAKYFALIGIAGKWAAKFKILPIEIDIFHAIKNTFDNWLSSEVSCSDALKGVFAVRDFLFKHQDSRFKPYPELNGDQKIRGNLAGYYSKESGTYMLTSAGMKEAVAGYDVQQVCKNLDELKLLECYGGRYQKKISCDKKRPYIYAISERILEVSSFFLGETPGTGETEGAE